MSTNATVQEHMTLAPVTVASTASVAEAATLMRERAIRHLPVVDEGRLVGVLSERDVNVARTLRSTNLEKARVALVMNHQPLAVPADARLSDVCARMLDRKVGSAIVVHGDRVVGIFTSNDALLALHRILAEQG